MSAAKSFLDIPTHPAERRAWILFRLKAKALSFRAVAKKNGCSPQALHDAARGVPMLRLERALAEAIDVDPIVLFPEHYAADGTRIPQVRGRHKTDKSGLSHTPSDHSCNVKNGEAA